MWNRWGMGPVFVYESMLNARRWQIYAARSCFVLLLLVGLAFVWVQNDTLTTTPVQKPSLYQQMALLGEKFFYAMAGIQVSLILLAAPAAAAGSICMDRARGTLAHMMVTELSDPEIVLGKLGSRLAPIIGLMACGVPVAALATLLGGVEFGAIAGLFVVSASLAVLGCTLSLTISVWAAKTHEVLLLLPMPLYVSIFLASSVLDVPAYATSARYNGLPPLPLTVYDRVLAVVYSLADFLASGAMIVSLGLALATWVPPAGTCRRSERDRLFSGWDRLGFTDRNIVHAVRESTAGRLVRSIWLAARQHCVAQSAIRARTTDRYACGNRVPGRSLIWLGTGIAILIKATIAGLLLWLTIKTFDRCLGRAPETMSPTHVPEPTASEKLPASALTLS